MTRFILVTFGFLGWSYYELSGGADFVPEDPPVAALAAPAKVVVTVQPAQREAEIVTRAAQTPLVTLASAYVPQPLPEPEPVSEPDPEPVAQIVEVSEEPVALDLRAVSGARVNMRSGPGTNHAVLATLSRGTQARVLEVNANGWARVVISQTGQEGWMAARLLTDS